MNGPMQGRRRFLLLLAPFLLASAVMPAGRSDAAEAASAGEVADGLKKIASAALEAAEYAGTDKAKAEESAGEIEPVWAKIEDTIRNNSKDSYLAFENAIEGVEDAAKAGDAKKAGGAAGALSSAVTFYVAKFPTGDAAPSPAAAPAAAPKQAAPAPKESAASADKTAAAADEKKAAADSAAAPAAEAADGTLARTGPSSALTAVAGSAFGLGGLALIGGARRRRSRRAA